MGITSSKSAAREDLTAENILDTCRAYMHKTGRDVVLVCRFEIDKLVAHTKQKQMVIDNLQRYCLEEQKKNRLLRKQLRAMHAKLVTYGEENNFDYS